MKKDLQGKRVNFVLSLDPDQVPQLRHFFALAVNRATLSDDYVPTDAYYLLGVLESIFDVVTVNFDSPEHHENCDL